MKKKNNLSEGGTIQVVCALSADMSLFLVVTVEIVDAQFHC